MIIWQTIAVNFLKRIILYPFVYSNFWHAYLSLFRLNKSSSYCIRLRSGELYNLRGGPEDIGTVDEVYMYSYYKRRAFELKPDDVVIDIGAYIGDYTVFAAKRACRGKVFAFEPMTKLYRLAKKNLKLNTCHNATLFPFGLAETTDVTEFSANTLRPLADSSMYAQSVSPSMTSLQKALVVNINGWWSVYGKYKPSYLKIDCEGAEFELLYSLDKRFFSTVRVMIIEYHNIFSEKRNNSRSLTDYLQTLGFIVEDTGGLIYSNIGILFCRKNV